MIKSISYDQSEILQNILKLCKLDRFQVDPTYSKGNFYKHIPKPEIKFDIAPQSTDVTKACATHLPLFDNSITSLIFDPPFLATKGPSLTKEDESNKILKRFSVLDDEVKLHQFYKDALNEFKRVLKSKGVLVFKCQDKVSSGKQYFMHCIIYNMSQDLGFYAKDLFVLLAKNRMTPAWQLKNQKHARKFHSYFWVFING
jgi:hypothetical protein